MSGRIRWSCQCDCGSLTIVDGNNLRSGHTRSCGCWKGQFITIKKRKHGFRKTREYGVWCGMLRRSSDPKSVGYQNYGGRGIEASPEWQDNVEIFYADLVDEIGPHPGKGWSIDRIDNNGDYQRGDIKWSTRTEQNRNQRRSQPIPIGTRLGRWTVLEGPVWRKRTVGYQPYYQVRCDCGTEKLIAAPALRSGKSFSCGCLRRELQRTGMGFESWLPLIAQQMRMQNLVLTRPLLPSGFASVRNRAVHSSDRVKLRVLSAGSPDLSGELLSCGSSPSPSAGALVRGTQPRQQVASQSGGPLTSSGLRRWTTLVMTETPRLDDPTDQFFAR